MLVESHNLVHHKKFHVILQHCCSVLNMLLNHHSDQLIVKYLHKYNFQFVLESFFSLSSNFLISLYFLIIFEKVAKNQKLLESLHK